MRMLEMNELQLVGGGEGECTAGDGGNSYGGVVDTTSIGGEFIEMYEGVVEAVSHVIERVAGAL